MNKLINIFLFFSYLFVTMPVHAQSPAFYHLSTAEGLSDNTVHTTARDKNGILWIGTNEGLNSFDGNSITTFNRYRYPMLAANVIENIVIAQDNKIWIRTNTHTVNMLDEKRNFHLYNVGDSTDRFRVSNIFYLKSKGIIALKGRSQFILTNITDRNFKRLVVPEQDKLPSAYSIMNKLNDDSVYIYGKDSLAVYDYKHMKMIMSIPLPGVNGITALNTEELIAYTDKGDVFYRISISQKKIIKEYRNLVDQFQQPVTGSLRNSTALTDNTIVFTSRFGGLYYVDFEKETILHVEHDPLDSKSLGGNNTYKVRYDKESGYLFVATLTTGLHYYNTRINQLTYKPYFIDNAKLVFDGFIHAVTTSNDGTIWMGAQDRLISWNRKKNNTAYVPLILPDGTNLLGQETIRAVQFDANDNLWVGTSTKGVLIINKQAKRIAHLTDSMPPGSIPIPANWINAIHPDKKGNIWVGTIRGTCIVEKNGFKVLNLSSHPLLKKIHKIPCTTLWTDKEGSVWISTVSGIWRFNEKNNTLKQYTIANGLANNVVYAVNEDNSGNYYFATASGLSVLSPDGKIISYNRSNGLKNDRCEGVLKDERGYMWIGNMGSILRFDPETKKFAAFEEGYGHNYGGFRIRTGYRSNSGEMFWGTDKGLTFFFPEKMNRITQPLNPVINALFISDSAYRFTRAESLTFPFNTAYLVFNFSPGELAGGKRNQFLYRLSGYDEAWKTPVMVGQVSFNKLPPGHYTFEVKASRDGNTWYTAAYPISIVIQKPWWQQNWFIILSIMVLAAIAYFMYRQAVNRKNKREAENVIDYFTSSTYENASVEDILWDICRNCIYMLKFEDSVIYLLDKEKKELVQKAAYGPKNTGTFEIKNPITIPVGQGIVGHVAASGKAEIIKDTSRDSRYIIDDEKRMSEIAVPILHEGKVIGVIDSEHRKKDFFTTQHLKTLQKIASLSGARISHAIAMDAMKQSRLELMELNVKMAESRFSNLRLQMNPHFLFNSLSSIQHLIVSQQTTKAYKYLTVFSNFLRTLLNFAEKNFIPLDEEIKILNMYLELESLRFDQSFTYEIVVDENLTNDEILLPSLMIQPFAENAIWHGLLHKEGDKKLTIRINNISEEYLSCIIEDNGIGRAKSAEIQKNKIKSTIHESKGIGIIEERLNLMQKKTGKPARVEIIDLSDHSNQATGTKVIITIPYYNPEQS